MDFITAATSLVTNHLELSTLAHGWHIKGFTNSQEQTTHNVTCCMHEPQQKMFNYLQYSNGSDKI